MLFNNIMNIFEPSIEKPYVINTKAPIILRTACSAGINRSATVREYVRHKIHNKSVVLQQYGAEFADYDNKKILNITLGKDGFSDLFGFDKQKNIQCVIFSQLGYPTIGDYSTQVLKEEHRKDYKNILINYFWTVKIYGTNHKKNIFILINENQDVIDLVIKRLYETKEDVDLVILRIPDIIRDVRHVKSQSKEAYQQFVNVVKKYIIFV